MYQNNLLLVRAFFVLSLLWMNQASASLPDEALHLNDSDDVPEVSILNTVEFDTVTTLVNIPNRTRTEESLQPALYFLTNYAVTFYSKHVIEKTRGALNSLSLSKGHVTQFHTLAGILEKFFVENMDLDSLSSCLNAYRLLEKVPGVLLKDKQARFSTGLEKLYRAELLKLAFQDDSNALNSTLDDEVTLLFDRQYLIPDTAWWVVSLEATKNVDFDDFAGYVKRAKNLLTKKSAREKKNSTRTRSFSDSRDDRGANSESKESTEAQSAQTRTYRASAQKFYVNSSSAPRHFKGTVRSKSHGRKKSGHHSGRR